MSSNFENAATFYDRLSRLVYGKALLNAQRHFLDYIKPSSNILIIGGGTGKIMEQITALYNEGLSITYVEISAKMMALSKKRAHGNNKVTYINQAIEEVLLERNFDVIITSFFFINFKQENVDRLFDHIQVFLKPGGLWLNTDFQSVGKWWQGFLLKSMFWFFKLICNIETTHLPKTAESFYRYGYQLKDDRTFFSTFIKSAVYLK
jgi:ubiquinone/menaquinone biosynthesis C-methylase UbiE